MESLTKDQLQQAGFSDIEINNFFENEKIIEKKQEPETEKINEIDRGPIKNHWQNVINKFKDYSEGRKKLREDLPKAIYGEKSEFIDYMRVGMGASNFGLISALIKGEDLPTAYQREVGEDESFLEGLVQRGTTLVFDLPFYLLGARAGGANPITSTFGAGFVAGGIRKTLIEAINKKQVNEPIDYMNIILEEGIEAGLKEGFQLSAAVNAPRLLGPLGKNYFAKVISRFSAFEGIGVAMHGELPSGRELAYSGILWGLSGFDSQAKIKKAEKHYKKKAEDIYIETNKKPTQVLIEENLDKTIKNDNDSINIKIPRTYQKEKTITSETEILKTEKPQEIIKTEKITSEDPAMQHMFDNMSFGEKPVIPWFDKIKDAKDKFEIEQIDFRSPVKQALIQADINVKPKIGELNLYEQSLQLSRNRNIGDFFLLKKTTDGKLQINGESLFDILGNLTKKELQEYSAYETAVFNKTITKRGFKTPFENKFTEQVISNKNYIKKYEGLRKRVVKFRERVLQYVKEKGRITEEQYKAIKELNENYVPLFREIKNIEGTQVIGKGYALKQRKGSLLKVLDTLESTKEITQRLIEDAETNNLRVKFIEELVIPQQAKNNPAFRHIQKQPVKQKSVQEIRDQLLKDNVYSKEQLNLLSDKAIIQLDAYRPKNYFPEKDTFVIYRNGKKEIWNVGEELVRATSPGLSKQFDMLQKFANPVSRLTRGGAIFIPGFILKNFFQDSVLATTSLRVGWIPVIDSFVGLANIILAKSPGMLGNKKIKELYLEWERSGGPQSTILKVDQSLRDTPVHKIFNEAKLKNKLTSPWETYVKGTLSLSEEMTRFRIFQKVRNLSLKKGLTLEQSIKRGGFDAADLLDYGRMGTKGAYLNSIIPFWNVTAQGARKIYTTLKDNTQRAMIGIFASVVLPTIIEQLIYADDPEYQKQEDWIKENYWYARINDIEYKIPKPFQIGTFFSGVTVGIMNFFRENYKKEFDVFLKDFFISQIKGFNPIPQVVKPLIEIGTNKNFFTGRNVIPTYLDRTVEDPYQATPYTSETMKLIAKSINSILPDNTSILINNPIYLDHIVRSYLATLGKHLLKLSDKLLIETGMIEDPQKMSSELSDYPLARAFVLPKVPKWSSIESRFLKELDVIKKRDGTIKLLEKNGDFKEAAELKAKYPFDLDALKKNEKSYRDITQSIIKISNAKLEVLLEDEEYKSLTKTQREEKIKSLKDEKFEQIRKLRTLQIIIAAQSLNMLNIKVAIPEEK